MITKAINQQLKADTDLTTLAGGATYFFAELGRGDKSIVTSQTDKGRAAEPIPDVMNSPIQVLVSGYDIDAGEKFAHKVVGVVEGLKDQTLSITDWEYTIKSIMVVSEPVLIRWKDANAFTINFNIFYRQNFLA